MSDIGSSSNIPQQQVHLQLPENANVKDVHVYQKPDAGGKPDFLIVVWLAFFSSLTTSEEKGQVQVLELQHTQTEEVNSNHVMATYNYTNLTQADMSLNSWNPEINVVSEYNDRVQAQISITQNTIAVEQQTAQTQTTNENTTAQASTEDMSLGVGMAKEIKQITDVIITI